MASSSGTLRLKQSSLLSFLTSPPPSTFATTHGPLHHPLPPPLPTTAAQDYERLRQENIRRNEAFLHRLGVTPLASPPPIKKKKTSTTTVSVVSPPPPLRRSTRNRPSEPASPDEPPPTAFLDSPVFHFTCTVPNTTVASPPTTHLSISGSRLRIAGRPLRDPSLSKIYSMDVCGALVTAGGHGGVVVVFGAGEESEAALVSWKAGGSWIAGVAFVGSEGKVVATCCNDGRVVAWDVTRQGSAGPPAVAEAEGLHRAGVFGMDLTDGCWLATASKDSSVGLARVAEDGRFAVDRRIDGHHSGVIRGVSFGESKDKLADCGADGRICVLDTRLPEPCTLTIESKHTTGVNTVEWCPSNMFLLMSASKDPVLLLYDIRNPSSPSHELHGHCEPRLRTCTQIYRPAFVDDGAAIATPGPGSKKISIFSVETGKLSSQGTVGYDPNLILFTPSAAGCTSLWTAARQINQLYPCDNQGEEE